MDLSFVRGKVRFDGFPPIFATQLKRLSLCSTLIECSFCTVERLTRSSTSLNEHNKYKIAKFSLFMIIEQERAK